MSTNKMSDRGRHLRKTQRRVPSDAILRRLRLSPYSSISKPTRRKEGSKHAWQPTWLDSTFTQENSKKFGRAAAYLRTGRQARRGEATRLDWQQAGTLSPPLLQMEHTIETQPQELNLQAKLNSTTTI